MVRITKVYTKKGDKGKTQIAAKIPLSKNSLRIHALGDIDELNAFLGFTAESLLHQAVISLKTDILRIQNELFNLGAQLSVLPEYRRNDTPHIHQDDIKKLEDEIDDMNTALPPLTSFILPGGDEISARFHVARTVCRRAERTVIALSEIEQLDGTEIPYLNRLSDWLFVAARYVTSQLEIQENLWIPGKRD